MKHNQARLDNSFIFQSTSTTKSTTKKQLKNYKKFTKKPSTTKKALPKSLQESSNVAKPIIQSHLRKSIKGGLKENGFTLKPNQQINLGSKLKATRANRSSNGNRIKLTTQKPINKTKSTFKSQGIRNRNNSTKAAKKQRKTVKTLTKSSIRNCNNKC